MSRKAFAPRLEPNHEVLLSLAVEPGAGDPGGMPKHWIQLLFALSKHMPAGLSAKVRDKVPAGVSAEMRSKAGLLPGAETAMLHETR